MSLDDAQRSPIGSSPGYAPSSWADSDEERLNHHGAPSFIAPSPPPKDPKAEALPASLAPTQPQPIQTAWQGPKENSTELADTPAAFQSKNPFLKPRSPIPRKAVPQVQDPGDRNEWSDDHSNMTANSEPLSQSEGYIPMTARLSLFDGPEDHSAWTEQEPYPPGTSRGISNNNSMDPSHWASENRSPQESQYPPKISAPQELYMQGQPANPYAPAVVVQLSDPTENSLDHQSAYFQGKLGSENGAHSPSAFSNATSTTSATSATSHELIDLDVPTSPLGIDIGSQQQRASSTHSSVGGAQTLSNGISPALPSSQSSHLLDDTPIPTPAQPRPKLSAAEEARQQEQRSETYSIRQINWKNRAGNVLQSPILVQNKNGPCPLLALINALVLSAEPATHPPILKALQTREQISLGLLIQALFDELTSGLGANDEFPDIEALSQFLTMLHTGMNVNPRLTLETVDSLGIFSQTADIQLYSTFGVPLIHGWLAPWSSQPHHAMSRTAQYHEDIQLLPFRKQELEDRVMRGESLSPDEESRMADIQTIQQFVDVENLTQLSPFGLAQLKAQLAPGSISIFFRNDHFSTLYKHPQSHQLYTLVTDAGYANHAEVVWESLVDVTGFNTEFLSGDFRSVSHASTNAAAPAPSTGSTAIAGPRSSSVSANNTLSTTTAATPGRLSPQEQADADYAYALSLQFQEEEQRGENRSQSSNITPNQTSTRTFNTPEHNRRTSAPPGPTDRNSPHVMSSPPNIRSSGTAVGLRPPRRPHHDPDPDDPNAPPPPYEQAARTPQYHSPDRQAQYSNTSQEDQPPGRTYSGNTGTRNRYSDYQTRPTNPGRYNPNQRNSKDCIVM